MARSAILTDDNTRVGAIQLEPTVAAAGRHRIIKVTRDPLVEVGCRLLCLATGSVSVTTQLEQRAYNVCRRHFVV